jgi:ABC-2 type transport system permease protein
MSIPSDTLPEPSVDPQGIAPASSSATRPLYWSVRRELWEYRSIYLAPLAAAAVVLFGFLISTVTLPSRMRAAFALDPVEQRGAIVGPYDIATGLILGTAVVVVVFYCLDALHAERRDRSILFWKSLPVSDLTTVLSKAIIPLVVLQLLPFAIVVATHFIMLLLSSAVLAGSGLSVGALWTQLSLFQMSLMLLYHLVTVHALWYAPIYAWMLLVSAWARRAALLWAFLPPIAICVVEKIAFNTSRFAALLKYRVTGGAEAMAHSGAGMFPVGPGMHLTPGRFLSTPGLWLGLAVAAAFLAAAVRLRRYREPI